MERYTVRHFNEDFPDDDACLDFILHTIYPEGVQCRVCQKVRKHHRLNGRKAYSCDYCGTHVYPLAGTIFEKSRTSLKSWFYAMYLMSSTRCGISAKQLERELGVTYKTAWRMFKQIRLLLGEDAGQMDGEVEVDEMYMGGTRRNTPRGRPGADSHKVPVIGVAGRERGKVAAYVTADASAKSAEGVISKHVLPRSLIYTDEYRAYDKLGKKGYIHNRIPHAQNVYVWGSVHTNTIEGFWSLVKRGISGVYHSVSAKYLQHYLDEYSFRYNHRDDVQAMYSTVLGRMDDVPYGVYGDYSPVRKAKN